jgi:hypothetical protein
VDPDALFGSSVAPTPERRVDARRRGPGVPGQPFTLSSCALIAGLDGTPIVVVRDLVAVDECQQASSPPCSGRRLAVGMLVGVHRVTLSGLLKDQAMAVFLCWD